MKLLTVGFFRHLVVVCGMAGCDVTHLSVAFYILVFLVEYYFAFLIIS